MLRYHKWEQQLYYFVTKQWAIRKCTFKEMTMPQESMLELFNRPDLPWFWVLCSYVQISKIEEKQEQQYFTSKTWMMTHSLLQERNRIYSKEKELIYHWLKTCVHTLRGSRHILVTVLSSFLMQNPSFPWNHYSYALFCSEIQDLHPCR